MFGFCRLRTKLVLYQSSTPDLLPHHPASSPALEVYDHHPPDFPDRYIKSIFGWVSGVHLDDLGQSSAAVLDGQSGELHSGVEGRKTAQLTGPITFGEVACQVSY